MSLPTGRPTLGARWDYPNQDERLARAATAGLIDYVEANFPITPGHPPRVGEGVPVLVHCPINPIASPQGVNLRLAEQVREAADAWDSPWVGEHLCWAGPGAEGRLGYIVTPILCEAFVEVAARNARALQAFYGRPVALELAPVYQHVGALDSELRFLARVAEAGDTLIILDVAHWTASNRNLGRAADFGLDALPAERIVELHVAGIRAGQSGRWWHDSHDRVPEEEILTLTATLVRELPALRAVTFEHSDAAPETDLVRTLEQLRRVVS
ncbi:MAG: DUF692 family protein [Alphaproteobacteria bacterium]|nr:DUF692 family protein [Alphaproteobacteria bacterium]